MSETRYNFAEKIMLQHAYIPKLVVDCIGIVFGVYFLWTNQLVLAVLSLIGLSIVGNIIAWKQDLDSLAERPLGQWMLRQANPINLLVRSVGALILSWGLWWHSALFIVAGIAVIAIARVIPRLMSRTT